MGLEDIAKSAGEFIEGNKDKIEDALHSEQAEGVSDSVLDGVAGFVNKVTGGKFEEQIDGARDEADKNIGDN